MGGGGVSCQLNLKQLVRTSAGSGGVVWIRAYRGGLGNPERFTT